MIRLYLPQEKLELRTPSEVPTKVRIVEEPLAPEGKKGGEEARAGRALPEASHLYLHPNSFQLAVRFLENQSPSFALPRAPFFPSHLRLPQTYSKAFLGSQRSTCQKAAFSLPECPSSSSLPATHGLPTTSPCQNPPPQPRESPGKIRFTWFCSLPSSWPDVAF